MGKRQIRWCHIGISGAIMLQCAQYDLALLPTAISNLMVFIYFGETVMALFSQGDVSVTFKRFLIALILSVVCHVIFRVYDCYIKRRIDDKYEIDRMIKYSEIHLNKSNSKLVNTCQTITSLVILAIALAPGAGICYGLYLFVTGSHLAGVILILSVLATAVLYMIARFICVTAWRKM